MPTDFNGREPDISQDGEDAPLFAAQPIWERGRKRRGFGGRKTAAPAPSAAAPEPRSFEREEPAMTLNDPMDRPMAEPIDRPATMTNTTLAAEEPLAAPISRPVRTTRAKASSGASPAVIAGGVAALLVIGAGGWYLARPHDGVPVLTPGQPTTSEVAAAPVTTPDTGGVSVATNTLPARATPAATPPRAQRQVAQQQARVRPAARAAAPSADASSSNASAVLPDGPRPYSSINPAAPPTQVTPAAPPPVEAAQPAAIPQTPPTQTPQTAPPPTETPPPTPPSA